MTWYIAPEGTPAPRMAHLDHQFIDKWDGWTVHTEQLLSVLLEARQMTVAVLQMTPFTVDDPPGSPFLIGYESDCHDYRCIMFGVTKEPSRPDAVLLDHYGEWTAGWSSKRLCKVSVRELFGSSLERII